MRSLLWFVAIPMLGCDVLSTEAPGLFNGAPRREPAPLAPSSDVQSLGRLAGVLANRFKPPAMPSPSASLDCAHAGPAEALARDARIVLSNIDARRETKNLIPRRVSERLDSGETAWLSTLLDAPAESQQKGLNAPSSAASLTAEDLTRMQGQRYLGVFYVTDYQGPALILRVGKIRREWLAGQLAARFALFEGDSQRLVCVADLRVKNDVTTAPIRSRLQAETRSRLERSLGDALRGEAERVTASLGLHWPETH